MDKGQITPHLTLSYVFSRLDDAKKKKKKGHRISPEITSAEIYEAPLHHWCPLVSGWGQGIRQKALLCISTQKKNITALILLSVYISVLSGHLKQRVITGVKEMTLYNETTQFTPVLLKGVRVIIVLMHCDLAVQEMHILITEMLWREGRD